MPDPRESGQPEVDELRRRLVSSPIRRLAPGLVLALTLLAAAAALATDELVVENWGEQKVGATGLPSGWEKQTWGSPRYDRFTVVEDGGRRALRLKSEDDSSNIARNIKGKVNLKETPILEWSWKAVTLPQGADCRRKETDDEAAQLYVAWPRFPEAVRSRIIGYLWDTTAPVGTIVKSQKNGTVTYVVVRSGPADLGRWLTERRDVREDFKRIYGEEPESPGGVSFGIDSDDTKGSAESFMGTIRFTKP
jgi:hypothetical protein